MASVIVDESCGCGATFHYDGPTKDLQAAVDRWRTMHVHRPAQPAPTSRPAGWGEPPRPAHAAGDGMAGHRLGGL